MEEGEGEKGWGRRKMEGRNEKREWKDDVRRAKRREGREKWKKREGI